MKMKQQHVTEEEAEAVEEQQEQETYQHSATAATTAAASFDYYCYEQQHPIEEYRHHHTYPSCQQQNQNLDRNNRLNTELSSNIKGHKEEELDQEDFELDEQHSHAMSCPILLSKKALVEDDRTLSLLIQEEEEEEEEERSPSSCYNKQRFMCHDWIFLLPLIALVLLMAVYGLDQNKGLVLVHTVPTFLLHIFYCGLWAIGISLVWILLMICGRKQILRVTVWMLLGISVILGSIFTGVLYHQGYEVYYWPAIAFGSLALMALVYGYWVRSQMTFVSAHLHVIVSALLELPALLLIAFIMAWVQIAWFILCLLGSFGILYDQEYVLVVESSHQIEVRQDAYTQVIIFGLLLFGVFIWGVMVLKSSVHVAIAGTLGAWSQNTQTYCMTLRHWLTSCTIHLGSICRGTIVVPLLELLGRCCNYESNAKSKVFFNRFAYVFLGTHEDLNFPQSNEQVCAVIHAKGWWTRKILYDNGHIPTVIFGLVDVLVGAVLVYIGTQFVHHHTDMYQNIAHAQVVVGLFAFWMGFYLNHILLCIFSSAMSTILVLWAQDPFIWQLNRPEEYEQLDIVWQQTFPNEYNHGDGSSSNTV